MTEQETAVYERILTQIGFRERGLSLAELSHREAYTTVAAFLRTIVEEAGCYGYLFIVSVTKLEERYGDSLTPLLWEILDGFLLGGKIDKETAFAAFYNLGLHYARRFDAESLKKLLAPGEYFSVFYTEFPLTYEIIARYCGVTGMYDRQMLAAKCTLKLLDKLARRPAADRTTARGFVESCENVAVKIAFVAALAAHMEKCYLRETLQAANKVHCRKEWEHILPEDLGYLLEQNAEDPAYGVSLGDVRLAQRYVEEACHYNPAYPKYPYLKAQMLFFGDILEGRQITAHREREIYDLLAEARGKENPDAADYGTRIAIYNAFGALVQNHVAVQGDPDRFRRSIRYERERMEIVNLKECPPAQDRPRLGCVDGEDFIFISYSTQDFRSVYVDLLELGRRGVRFWYDRGTIPGEKWYETVEERVKNASCVVCYLSKDFMISEPVYKELTLIRKYQKPVICVDLTGQRRISRAVADVIRNGKKEVAERLTSRVMDVLFDVFDDDADVIARNRDAQIAVHIDRLCGVLREKYPATLQMVLSESGTCQNDIVYEGGIVRPNEDYFVADDKNKIYIVADGISRGREEYRKFAGSITAEVSRLFCEELSGWLSGRISVAAGLPAAETLLHEAFIYANGKVRDMLSARGEDFAGTETPGCVCIVAIVFDNKLIFGSAGDCMGLLVRGGQTLVFSQKQTTFAFDVLHKEKDRALLMQSFVNCPANAYGYGVVNGDERAKDCFRVSHLDLEYGDAVYLVSDGISDYIQYSPGQTVNALPVEELFVRSAQQDRTVGKLHSDDKTIVRIRIDSVQGGRLLQAG